jgi:hypothetical protein
VQGTNSVLAAAHNISCIHLMWMHQLLPYSTLGCRLTLRTAIKHDPCMPSTALLHKPGCICTAADRVETLWHMPSPAACHMFISSNQPPLPPKRT